MEELVFQHRTGRLKLGSTPLVMGILNVTPDSFSDGSRYLDPERATHRALDMVAAGADIVDIGGESTRPGAEPVDAESELDRVVPVLERLCARTSVPLSIDTSKASVAERAIAAGASIINDVSGMHADPRMMAVAARTGAGCILMHMRGTPRTMQKNLHYDNLVEDIVAYFEATLQQAERAGIARNTIMLDPGIGFSKNAEQNLTLITAAGRFRGLGRPVLLGPSRKSFLGKLLDEPEAEKRIWGTAAAVACGILAGADVVRVHDVGEMRQVSTVAGAIRAAASE